MAVAARMNTCVTEMTAPPISNGSRDSTDGYDLGLGFQIIIANVCNSSDMPMAVMSGANLGELRNGR